MQSSPHLKPPSSWATSRRVGARVAGAKVLVDESTDLIVGAHLLGHNVEEVINAFAVAIKIGKIDG